MLATLRYDNAFLTCLGHLGRYNTDRIISTTRSSQVRKAICNTTNIIAHKLCQWIWAIRITFICVACSRLPRQVQNWLLCVTVASGFAKKNFAKWTQTFKYTFFCICSILIYNHVSLLLVCGCTAWNYPQEPLDVCDHERLVCFQKVNYKSNLISVRINQLPISAARWQHSSEICLLLLFSEKSQNC